MILFPEQYYKDTATKFNHITVRNYIYWHIYSTLLPLYFSINRFHCTCVEGNISTSWRLPPCCVYARRLRHYLGWRLWECTRRMERDLNSITMVPWECDKLLVWDVTCTNTYAPWQMPERKVQCQLWPI